MLLSLNLQNHLDLIYQWSLTWQLKISHSKCNIFNIGPTITSQRFFLSNSPLPSTNLTVDLGISFDPTLTFKYHIYNIVKRAKLRGSLIHRSFVSRNVANLIRAFKTYVRPIVEYAPQIWSPHQISLINLVEGVQRSFTKRLPGLASLSYADRLALLQLQSLEHRRLLTDLVTCFNIVHGYTALTFEDFFSYSNLKTTRGHRFKIVIPLAKTNVKKYCFSNRIIPIWNSLPPNFVSATSTSHFKSLIVTHDFSRFLTFESFIYTKPK